MKGCNLLIVSDLIGGGNFTLRLKYNFCDFPFLYVKSLFYFVAFYSNTL